MASELEIVTKRVQIKIDNIESMRSESLFAWNLYTTIIDDKNAQSRDLGKCVEAAMKGISGLGTLLDIADTYDIEMAKRKNKVPSVLLLNVKTLKALGDILNIKIDWYRDILKRYEENIEKNGRSTDMHPENAEFQRMMFKVPARHWTANEKKRFQELTLYNLLSAYVRQKVVIWKYWSHYPSGFNEKHERVDPKRRIQRYSIKSGLSEEGAKEIFSLFGRGFIDTKSASRILLNLKQKVSHNNSLIGITMSTLSSSRGLLSTATRPVKVVSDLVSVWGARHEHPDPINLMKLIAAETDPIKTMKVIQAY